MFAANRHHLTLLASAMLLSACAASPPPQLPPTEPGPRVLQDRPSTRASFACTGALPAVHRQICASDSLSQLERQVTERYRDLRLALDVPGRLLLDSNQRLWSTSLGNVCSIAQETDTRISGDPQAQACLSMQYQRRLGQLQGWPEAQAKGGQTQHAMASYAEYRMAESRDDALCEPLQKNLNQQLREQGMPDAEQIPGARLLASSDGPVQRLEREGRYYEVDRYTPGLMAGYQVRSRGLTLNDILIFDDSDLPSWVATLPNYGGRAHASSSQTGDYGRLELFEWQGQTLLLVNETWGFYSPAARGESAFAGVYRLQGRDLVPQCLMRTYLTPPRYNTLDGLPVYTELQTALDELRGQPLGAFAQHERRDNHQLWQEHQWTLLNLPLLGADDWQRYGREAAIRQRQDAALEALFQWSERNINNKAFYRRLMPMLQPAHQELKVMFADQGMGASEAERAADLLFHETFARALENLQAPESLPEAPLPPFGNYRPRFAMAPAAGSLEQGRNFATLHSVVLNQAPLNVVNDFIDYETDTYGRERRGLAAEDDSALMAAVYQPETLDLLLRRGFPVNHGNRWGRTALMNAAAANQPESVRRLLQAGADVHAQTRQVADAGVGGPEREQAYTGRQTALLLAAQQADQEVIRLLLDADAAKQAWSGYSRQVCQTLDGNQRLDSQQRSELKSGLCAQSFEPLPITRQAAANLHAGEELVVREDGVDYAITLRTREPMTLFTRSLEMSPRRMRRSMTGHATTLVRILTSRLSARTDGQFQIYFPDLRANREDKLVFEAGFPIINEIGNAPGFNLHKMPEQQVLRLVFNPTEQSVEVAWRQLYSAALTQGFVPTHQGYVVTHRGGNTSEYQLVVTER
ncbi:ankyrin repeat domain-containing protein [Halopseudomonas salegens]|uniref:Ankyrin repeat-containing protein n=1 Tax=Halopseudomonas salegens TaxID=1434072 RepID=A0A1H2FB74_9GAMM|nr:ankyrin repeat domain-containing protein [Halopseudomonas salegens]SDU04594.1 Ankyrin repeat-containing protein [Halopseudomonas salegens]